MAATVWVVASIIRTIVFFLALIHKPLYKLQLFFYLIIWIAFVLSDLQEIRSMRYIIIILSPLLFFSTLSFTMITTIVCNLCVLVLLYKANKFYFFKITIVIMIIQILGLIKFDLIITRILWNEVRLDHGYYDF